eukprot:g4236.t1
MLPHPSNQNAKIHEVSIKIRDLRKILDASIGAGSKKRRRRKLVSKELHKLERLMDELEAQREEQRKEKAKQLELQAIKDAEREEKLRIQRERKEKEEREEKERLKDEAIARANAAKERSERRRRQRIEQEKAKEREETEALARDELATAKRALLRAVSKLQAARKLVDSAHAENRTEEEKRNAEEALQKAEEEKQRREEKEVKARNRLEKEEKSNREAEKRALERARIEARRAEEAKVIADALRKAKREADLAVKSARKSAERAVCFVMERIERIELEREDIHSRQREVFEMENVREEENLRRLANAVHLAKKMLQIALEEEKNENLEESESVIAARESLRIALFEQSSFQTREMIRFLEHCRNRLEQEDLHSRRFEQFIKFQLKREAIELKRKELDEKLKEDKALLAAMLPERREAELRWRRDEVRRKKQELQALAIQHIRAQEQEKQKEMEREKEEKEEEENREDIEEEEEEEDEDTVALEKVRLKLRKRQEEVEKQKKEEEKKLMIQRRKEARLLLFPRRGATYDATSVEVCFGDSDEDPEEIGEYVGTNKKKIANYEKRIGKKERKKNENSENENSEHENSENENSEHENSEHENSNSLHSGESEEDEEEKERIKEEKIKRLEKRKMQRRKIRKAREKKEEENFVSGMNEETRLIYLKKKKKESRLLRIEKRKKERQKKKDIFLRKIVELEQGGEEKERKEYEAIFIEGKRKRRAARKERREKRENLRELRRVQLMKPDVRAKYRSRERKRKEKEKQEKRRLARLAEEEEEEEKYALQLKLESFETEEEKTAYLEEKEALEKQEREEMEEKQRERDLLTSSDEDFGGDEELESYFFPSQKKRKEREKEKKKMVEEQKLLENRLETNPEESEKASTISKAEKKKILEKEKEEKEWQTLAKPFRIKEKDPYLYCYETTAEEEENYRRKWIKGKVVSVDLKNVNLDCGGFQSICDVQLENDYIIRSIPRNRVRILDSETGDNLIKLINEKEEQINEAEMNLSKRRLDGEHQSELGLLTDAETKQFQFEIKKLEDEILELEKQKNNFEIELRKEREKQEKDYKLDCLKAKLQMAKDKWENAVRKEKKASRRKEAGEDEEDSEYSGDEDDSEVSQNSNDDDESASIHDPLENTSESKKIINLRRKYIILRKEFLPLDIAKRTNRLNYARPTLTEFQRSFEDAEIVAKAAKDAAMICSEKVILLTEELDEFDDDKKPAGTNSEKTAGKKSLFGKNFGFGNFTKSNDAAAKQREEKEKELMDAESAKAKALERVIATQKDLKIKRKKMLSLKAMRDELQAEETEQLRIQTKEDRTHELKSVTLQLEEARLDEMEASEERDEFARALRFLNSGSLVRSQLFDKRKKLRECENDIQKLEENVIKSTRPFQKTEKVLFALQKIDYIPTKALLEAHKIELKKAENKHVLAKQKLKLAQRLLVESKYRKKGKEIECKELEDKYQSIVQEGANQLVKIGMVTSSSFLNEEKLKKHSIYSNSSGFILAICEIANLYKEESIDVIYEKDREEERMRLERIELFEKRKRFRKKGFLLRMKWKKALLEDDEANEEYEKAKKIFHEKRNIFTKCQKAYEKAQSIADDATKQAREDNRSRVQIFAKNKRVKAAHLKRQWKDSQKEMETISEMKKEKKEIRQGTKEKVLEYERLLTTFFTIDLVAENISLNKYFTLEKYLDRTLARNSKFEKYAKKEKEKEEREFQKHEKNSFVEKRIVPRAFRAVQLFFYACDAELERRRSIVEKIQTRADMLRQQLDSARIIQIDRELDVFLDAKEKVQRKYDKSLSKMKKAEAVDSNDLDKEKIMEKAEKNLKVSFKNLRKVTKYTDPLENEKKQLENALKKAEIDQVNRHKEIAERKRKWALNFMKPNEDDDTKEDKSVLNAQKKKKNSVNILEEKIDLQVSEERRFSTRKVSQKIPTKNLPYAKLMKIKASRLINKRKEEEKIAVHAHTLKMAELRDEKLAELNSKMNACKIELTKKQIIVKNIKKKYKMQLRSESQFAGDDDELDELFFDNETNDDQVSPELEALQLQLKKAAIDEEDARYDYQDAKFNFDNLQKEKWEEELTILHVALKKDKEEVEKAKQLITRLRQNDDLYMSEEICKLRETAEKAKRSMKACQQDLRSLEKNLEERIKALRPGKPLRVTDITPQEQTEIENEIRARKNELKSLLPAFENASTQYIERFRVVRDARERKENSEDEEAKRKKEERRILQIKRRRKRAEKRRNRGDLPIWEEALASSEDDPGLSSGEELEEREELAMLRLEMRRIDKVKEERRRESNERESMTREEQTQRMIARKKAFESLDAERMSKLAKEREEERKRKDSQLNEKELRRVQRERRRDAERAAKRALKEAKQEERRKEKERKKEEEKKKKEEKELDPLGLGLYEEDGVTELSTQEKKRRLDEYIGKLFKELDEDGSGELDKKEVGKLAGKLGKKFGFFGKGLDEA